MNILELVSLAKNQANDDFSDNFVVLTIKELEKFVELVLEKALDNSTGC